ncbi:helix-turn-helix domain-containing protein [Enterococcus faecalis]|uniref:helix-turn-helix domain-containing protein n=1 Tax=Enterococcus faecalis TaxID=1351 RepID=UPI0005345B0A|nr:helix-turn-helix transcriptional regulator [Enterococcus faecalis]KII48871.1 Cro/Cl family transcriptional regulator [Enterococcus faecalis]MCD5233294.1 helix-turn-helix transcriptional regulator [Enterococcus faecalis]HBI2075007.1 helix-turn-helix transcriptional regulator [Enterococcus faecalis]
MEAYEKIKSLRENKNITQQEIANAINMNISVYKKVELGSRPIRENELAKIADFFNVSSDYLLGRTKNPTFPQEDTTKTGQNIISHFRLNTSDMDVDDIEELEEELIDFQDFLIKKAKEKKARNKKD